MLKIQYTESAKADITSLSKVGLETHGISAVVRYNLLIRFTVDQLCKDPNQIGAKEVSKKSGVKIFHLRHYSKHVVHEGLKVKNPSHYVCYRVIQGDTLEIVRILREEMDLDSHL